MEHCPCTIRPVYGEAHDNIRVLGDTGCLINIGYDNPHIITLVHPYLPRNITIAECLYMDFLYITLLNYARLLGIRWKMGNPGIADMNRPYLRSCLTKKPAFLCLAHCPILYKVGKKHLCIVRLAVNRDNLEGLAVSRILLVDVYHFVVDRPPHACRTPETWGELGQGAHIIVIRAYSDMSYPVMDGIFIHNLKSVKAGLDNGVSNKTACEGIALVVKHVVERTSANWQHLLNSQRCNINYTDCCRKLVCHLNIPSLWLCICSMRVLSNRNLLYKLKGIKFKNTHCGMIIVA